MKEADKGDSDMALIDIEMRTGFYHWEITIEKVEHPENILMGVVRKGVSLSSNPLETGCFWGIQPLMWVNKR